MQSVLPRTARPTHRHVACHGPILPVNSTEGSAIRTVSPPPPSRGLRPVLLAGYQAVRPLPPDYEEHRAALLAARRLYLAIWHLAGGLPDERHLGQLRVFTGN